MFFSDRYIFKSHLPVLSRLLSFVILVLMKLNNSYKLVENQLEDLAHGYLIESASFNG